ncbi:MAG: ornithine cyclodeaminase family protein [Anaerolineae bacterium]|jgi:ornithine cyclodeaminase|nr:ornithine cyclodeaminase family protein [Anaerolineae bacterium]
MTEPYNPEFLFLTQEDVIASGGLDMAATLDDIELAYQLFESGQIEQPHKPVFRIDNPETGEEQYYLAVSMPVYVKGDINRLGHKWAAESMANAKRGDMPMGIDIILLHDMEHAIPHAIMEGGLITAMRTSAVAGVGAKYLANPGSKVAGLVGAGVIGRTMIMSLTTAMPSLEEIRLFDLNHTRSNSLAEEFTDQIDIKVVSSVEEAFKDADIITTQTTSRTPFVDSAWVPEGSYYAHMSAKEGKDEVFLETDKLVTDNWETLKTWDFFPPTRLAKEGLLNESEITNIGEIILGRKEGRTSKQQKILFANLGMGCLDIVVAERIYQNAKKRGLGKKLSLWEKPLWI